MIYNSINRALWVFTIGIIILLILPRLIQDGMFLDGMLYSAVSHNFAKGHGTFWFPHFSFTHHNHFHEQPPLMFALQGWFFKILGDSMYVERFYSFLFALLNAFLIHKIWLLLFKNDVKTQKLSWLPVLLWIIIPVCFWGFANNIEENTMSFFCLLSVFFTLKSILSNNIFWLFLSGIAIVLATLTKGLQGSFVLMFPFFWSVFNYDKFSFKKGFLWSLILYIIPAIIYLLLLLDDSIKESLTRYFVNRVLNSIQNVSNVENRFYLLGRLFVELSIPLVIAFIIWLINKKENQKINFKLYKNEALSFMLLGFSGSLPLMITLEQRGFYLNNSFPYFAIAIALTIAPKVLLLISHLELNSKAKKILLSISVLVLLSSILMTVLNFGKTGRDADKLHDVYLIGKHVPYGSIISVPHFMHSEWTLQCYFIRYFYISLDSKNSEQAYFLKYKKDDVRVPDGYQLLDIGTITFDVYKKAHS
ncbi:MAG: ArnT family glycosyltransferase [Bacteroidia bacterium]